jgi:hypothetical protein
MCNIVIINTAVVVVRLYWFQRRFQHISTIHDFSANLVRTSRELIRSRSMSRSFSEARPEGRFNDGPDEERAVNGRRIRVILSTGKPMNATRTIPIQDVAVQDVPPRDCPIETLKAGEEQLEEDEAIQEQKEKIMKESEEGVSSGLSSEHEKQNEVSDSDPGNLGIHEMDFINGEQQSRAATPQPERPGRDIRFGDLPQPRKHERRDSEILPFENAVDDVDEEGMGRRTNTIEKNQMDSRRKVVRRRPSGKLLHPATFERILSNTFRRRKREGSITSRRSSQSNMTLPYFTFQPTVGRNSLFLGLTEEQREELGGIEYRASKLLLWILLIYFYGFLFFSWLCYAPWILRSPYYGNIVLSDGVSRQWWAIFTGASMFNDLGSTIRKCANAGFTLTPDSMISFQQTVFPLLIGSFFIVIG